MRLMASEYRWPRRPLSERRQGERHLLSSAFAATDPWCSGPTCQPVTLEIAGSNPVGSAIDACPYAPSSRPDGAFLIPASALVFPRAHLADSAGDPAASPAEPGPSHRRGSPRPVRRADRDRGGGRRGPGRRGHPAGQPWGVSGELPGPSGSSLAVGSASPGTSPASGGGSASPSDGSSPSPSADLMSEVAIVPVVDFRSTETSIKSADVRAALGAGKSRYAAVEVVAAEADAILAGLGLTKPADAKRWIAAPDVATLRKDLAKNRDRLAFIRADQVTPAVRALGWGALSLFGVDRVTKAGQWPLNARLSTVAGGDGFDPTKTWTIVAGGDVMLDRGVAKVVKVQGKGADFPFDGGTATITGRTCCSALLTRSRRRADGPGRRRPPPVDVGRPGRRQLREPGAGRVPLPHPGDGLLGRPEAHRRARPGRHRLVSLGNNHIGDAGAKGILDTIKNLKKNGIKSTGAGRTWRLPGSRPWSRSTGSRSPSSATTRSPSTTQRDPPRPAAPSSARPSSRPISRRPGPPVPTW